MRLALAAIIVLTALPAVVLAQPPVPGPEASTALPPIGLPLPPIGLPLPSIGLPLLPIGLPQATGTEPRVSKGRPSRAAEHQQPRMGARRHPRPAATVVYFVPTHGWEYPQPTQAATPGVTVPTTGRLRLDVQPSGLVLQYFVDGYFVGSPDDVNGELDLEAGPHRIEIRAPGYETLAFDVKIAAGRSITYRAALKPEADAAPGTLRVPSDTTAVAPEHATPATPTTFYYIPGCYIGNVPPEDVALPATCDLSRLITRKP